MRQPKLFTSLALLSLPALFSPACGPEFEDCTASRTCARAGAAGAAGSGAAAGSAGSGTAGSGGAAVSGGAAGSAVAAGSGGTTAAGGTSGGTGGTAGDPGASGEGGEPAGLGGGNSGTAGSGGTSGSSTDSGEGGEAGRPEPTACERAADCDDGLFCNGSETCEDGVCQAAANPDVCPDAAHCRVVCEEGDNAARCVAQALDADEDGHTAAQCAAAPGDDCDDGNDQIHPNATEACDGVDNDCDALVDLDDGLELTGVTRSVDGIKELDLAWIPGDSSVQGDEQFRMAFKYSSGEGIQSAVLDGSGALGREVSQLAMRTDHSHDSPRLSGATTTFGLAYAIFGRAGRGVSAIRASNNGVPSDDKGIYAGAPAGSFDITRRASAEWLLGIPGSQGVNLARYRDDGSVENGPQIIAGSQSTASSWVRIAAQADVSAVVWQVPPNLLRWARVSSNMATTEALGFGATGYRPDIVGSATGYALAWSTGSGIGFMRATTDGAEVCKKGLVPLGLDEASDSRRVALADSEHGALALVTSAAGKVVLVRFGLDCEPSIVPVANTPNPTSPAIAAGSDSVALAWVDTTTVTPKAYTRLVGQRLCE